MVTDAWSRLQNSNELQAYREATGKDIRMVMIPSLDDATTPASFLKPAMFWCVSADSDVKDAAVRFINFTKVSELLDQYSEQVRYGEITDLETAAQQFMDEANAILAAE